jgi:hypothetical protein
VRLTGRRGADPGKSRQQKVRAVTITRVGTNQKYSDGWEKAFAGKKGVAKAAQKKVAPSKKAAAKKKGKK